MTAFISVAELAAAITPGQRLAVPVDYAGVAMAVTDEIIRRGTDKLRLVCVPTGGMQVDLLIGSGLVASVETSAVSLGEAGGAPCFNRAVREAAIKIIDATCPAVHAGLMAAQKGVPFMPMRGLIGTDVLANRPDWLTIANPFAPDDPIVAIPAIHPDVALFHAPVADRAGNVWIGRRRELAAMAYAARRSLVTVERISETSLLSDEKTAAGIIPALYIDRIAVAPNGAWPYGLWGEYAPDTAELVRYAEAARSPDGFRAYVAARGQKLRSAA